MRRLFFGVLFAFVASGIAKAETVPPIPIPIPPMPTCPSPWMIETQDGTWWKCVPIPDGVIVCDDGSLVPLDGKCPIRLSTAPGGNTFTLTPPEVYGCLPGEERVLRGDFSVGCAKDVHPQTWH